MKGSKMALAALGVVGVTGLSMATEPASSSELQTTFSTIQTTFEGYASDVFPVLAAVVVAGLGIWVLPKIVRWLKRGFN